MPTRWILSILLAFAVASILGLVLALAGPVAPMRMLGAITMLLGVAGAIVHAQMLQDRDPHAWSILRYRIQMLEVHLHNGAVSIRRAITQRLAA